MNAYLLPGMAGLLLGMTLRWAGFSRPAALREALALRRSHALRSGLYALGFSMLLTALLCWLAVIDVDDIAVLPLSAAALIGGAVFGAAAGLCGYTPLTAFAGLGGGAAAEALCTMAGCFAAAFALPWLREPLSVLQHIPPLSDTTLFRVTLDEPFLLDGGFLGQGCAGLLLMTAAACIPSPRPVQPSEAAEPPESSEPPAPAEAAEPEESIIELELTAEDLSVAEEPEEHAEPEEPLPLLPAAEETFIALLPGEEPMVIDTQMDEAPESEEPAAPE